MQCLCQQHTAAGTLSYALRKILKPKPIPAGYCVAALRTGPAGPQQLRQMILLSAHSLNPRSLTHAPCPYA
jgi:hypothetical protein